MLYCLVTSPLELVSEFEVVTFSLCLAFSFTPGNDSRVLIVAGLAGSVQAEPAHQKDDTLEPEAWVSS